MEDKKTIKEIYLDNYEKELMQHLLKMLTSMQLLDGQLLESPDITEKWETLLPAYIQDAIPEITKYPSVSLGWAMYLGMAVARYWDEDWSTYGSKEDLYEQIRDIRGFDYMDEVIRGNILHLEGEGFDQMEKNVQSCAQQTLARIRHEQIEPQSPMAFHVYVRSIKVLYQLGAAIELKALGYKFEKIK